MESIANGVINVHVDPKDKAKANSILKELGLNMTTLINMTLKQVIKRNGIPFEVVNPEPSDRLKEALKELEDVESGKIKLKGYTNMEDFIKALNEE